MSDDVDFNDIVVSKGGRIDYYLQPNIFVPAIRWICHYGDQYPDIESTRKSAVPNEGTMIPFPMSPHLNTSVFIDSYCLVWFLNSLSRVILRNRTLIQGVDNIIANSHLLPDNLSLKKIQNECKCCEYGLVCSSSEFLREDKYKQTHWN